MICLISMFLLIIPITLVLALRTRAKKPALTTGEQPITRTPCPYCAELIMPGAKICRFCGRDLAGEPPSQ